MKQIAWLLLLLLAGSCSYFKQESLQKPVARVNNSYLYEEDLKPLQEQIASKEDSAQLVSNFINRWATQQLLINQANINLPQAQLSEFEKLVEQYRIDLYTEAYKSSIVAQQLDSTISKAELLTYYELNKENFKLNDELLKLRYIQVTPNFANLNKLVEHFKRFNMEDQDRLNEWSIQFKSFSLNDSTWVKKEHLVQSLPIVLEAGEHVLKKSNFTQLQDSLGVYLVKIEDVLARNDIAPLPYVEPTIRQIILNKRKQELTKKLEKDITKDAIRNNTFEIYPQH
ncbi:MAG TPA: peptidyl-prolyl cis-trans isomerase [Flavobacteriaceae bacterium]|nr:peptidyl-prolyl cis-trans isomerase [Flavobacteriaceae bacterium]MCB9212556.1 peptidyl-prolyl cis-trans isomerase [Alteromonas sp.]HPF10624.1 peptidyl-prolyl cis-trans isomerase [Flavobacteriaceae bacterium]HQU20906.1 peptidyl-prolyl cis-trans isomerase [Flavobacteriaceae bacterium]HQU64390.1 peptidyl-prolyl cis-trans isomerase [Flavobacteriaceae bacterium]